MSEHRVAVSWRRQTDSFAYEDYQREHEWQLGSGQRISASAAPAYLGSGEQADPEEAFVAAVSACHMLSFLAICARRRLVVDGYEDQAVGFLRPNEQGRLAVTRVELAPRIEFSGTPPDASELERLHARAHKECFIANSVRTEIVIT